VTAPHDESGSDGIDLMFHGDAELAPGLIDLAVNVHPAGPTVAIDAAVRAAIGVLGAYPDQRSAVAAVAARHDRSPDEVLITAGAAEAFVLVARAMSPCRAVVVHPQFTGPELALRAAGHRVDRLILTPADGFRLDPAHVPDDADLVMIGNPTNPTSVLHPPADLVSLARPGRTLVVDEAFADAIPAETGSLAGLSGVPGVVVVRSLTKTWGLAGLRVGYLLGPPSLVAALAAAQPPWPVSAPALAAAAAGCAPEAVTEADRRARLLAGHRESLVTGLRDRGARVVDAAAASFVLARFDNGERVRQALRERGFAVRRGDTFPGLGPDWLRIAVREPSVTVPFLAALDAALSSVLPR
jgi:histidinol-phosphate aminotransferase